MLDFAPDCRSDTDLMLAGYDFTTVAAGETAVEDNLLSHLIASRRETAGNGVRTLRTKLPYAADGVPAGAHVGLLRALIFSPRMGLGATWAWRAI